MISIAFSTGYQSSASARDVGLSAAAETRLAGRDEWIGLCAARLRVLRPHHDRTALDLIATDMWADVGSFDAVMAAELECEAWPPEH